MTKVLILFCLAIFLAPPDLTFAQADKGVGVRQKIVDGNRLALVIGNANYQNAGKLSNTLNDSRNMREVLRQLGFNVLGGDEMNADQMKKAIKDFGQKLKQGGIGLFYFSGHGIQANGRNYLIPVDAPELLREETLEFDAVDVNRVLGEMAAARNGFNIVILDACRNNPFSKGWRDAGGGGGGLAQIKAPTGTLIAYATAPDMVASDGRRQNGTYTEKLLEQIKVPNQPIEKVFKSVSEEVYSETNGAQDPWYASSLKGDFYFRIDGTSAVKPDSAGSTTSIGTQSVSSEEKPMWFESLQIQKTIPGEFFAGVSIGETEDEVFQRLGKGRHAYTSYVDNDSNKGISAKYYEWKYKTCALEIKFEGYPGGKPKVTVITVSDAEKLNENNLIPTIYEGIAIGMPLDTVNRVLGNVPFYHESTDKKMQILRKGSIYFCFRNGILYRVYVTSKGYNLISY